MAKVPRLIKAVLKFQNVLPEQVLSQGQALLKGLIGNPNFSVTPVDLNTFKADLENYTMLSIRLPKRRLVHHSVGTAGVTRLRPVQFQWDENRGIGNDECGDLPIPHSA
jgi:hypothetical protein